MKTDIQKKLATMTSNDAAAFITDFHNIICSTTAETLALAPTPVTEEIIVAIFNAIEAAFNDFKFGSRMHSQAMSDVAIMVLSAVGELNETLH